MRNTSHGAICAAIPYAPVFELIPVAKVIELDDEAGLIAFRAAERALSKAGYPYMDETAAYAVAHPEVVR